MTIAIASYEAVGARNFQPEGPFGAAGNTPLPSFKAGTVGSGDAEAEFVYLLLPVYTSRTLNQGDFIVWDNTYQAQVMSDIFVAVGYAFGTDVGTLYFGGRSGDPAAWPNAGNSWSYTFPTPGIYGIWVQRSGTSLGNWGTITSQLTPTFSTIVPGQMSAAAVATHGQAVTGLFTTNLSRTFTATTVTGSAVLTAITGMATLGTGIENYMTLSGAGIPNGTIVADFQGNTLTMNAAATASASVTITATKGTAWITTVNNSPVVTSPTINGLYPNALLTAVGVAGGAATIVSISGNQAPFQITLSGNSTASATVTATATKYVETLLRWPFVSGTAA
jgi:hypothetical protein